LEQQLVQLWQTLLRRERWGAPITFIGGDSLNGAFVHPWAIQSKAFPGLLLEAPTIEQLAKIISDAGWVSPWRCLVPIKASGSETTNLQVHGGENDRYQELIRHLPDQPCMESSGWIDGRSPRKNITIEAAGAIIDEIRRFSPEDRTTFAEILSVGCWLEMAYLAPGGCRVCQAHHYPSYPEFRAGDWGQIESLSNTYLHWGNLLVARPTRWTYEDEDSPLG
jgi:hypothetical protein